MSDNKKIRIGLVGAGYAAHLHCAGYQRVAGIDVELRKVCDVEAAKAEEIKSKYGFQEAVTDLGVLLGDPEIDVVDICAPPFLHVDMVVRALAADKHVICEKPLSGYFGKEGDTVPVGKHVSKGRMYKEVIASLDGLARKIESSSRKFYYAENYLYATPVQKMAEVISTKKSKILFMKAMVALKGSSSPVAGEWKFTGGGSLARNGTHPLTALLWLKRVEGEARGEHITVTSVFADMGTATACLDDHEHRHIAASPVDVEDNAVVVLTFSDGTKAMVHASDTVLGGTRNSIEVYCNDNALVCNLTPTDMLSTYFLDEENIEDIYLAEMLPSKLGWNKAFVSDDVVHGYSGELQQFCESIVLGKETHSDFSLAYLTTKIIYAAYHSAEEGRRIDL